MNHQLTNQSGIIKVQITKGDKVITAEMYVDHYLENTKTNNGIGDSMIQSVLNELDINYKLPTYH